jgi:hypothetical protein
LHAFIETVEKHFDRRHVMRIVPMVL